MTQHAVATPAVGAVTRLLGALIPRYELLVAFVRREVGIRYKEAYVGVAWAVLQPLAYAAIFTVLFARIARLPGSGPLEAYVALVPWTFASTAIAQGSQSILNQLSVVSKIYFPREVLPLSAIVAAGLDALIAFALQLVLQVLLGAGLPRTLLLWPLLMLLAAALCLGITLLVAPAVVRFRDLRYVIPFGLQLLLLASPIGYPLEAVPPGLRGWYRVNPFAGLMDAFRAIGLRGEVPPLVDLWPAALWAAGLVALGVAYFRAQQATLADYL
ncbi:MAG: ABC transporter permease [Actinomycetota bacterium]|nr:ABC transporter permease [Actinomycetota bacterium]